MPHLKAIDLVGQTYVAFSRAVSMKKLMLGEVLTFDRLHKIGHGDTNTINRSGHRKSR